MGRARYGRRARTVAIRSCAAMSVGSTRWLMLAAAAAVLCVATIASVLVVGSGSPVMVGSIDGRSVTREEFLFHLRRVLPAVENATGISSSDPTAWNRTSSDGSTPLRRLREAAITDLEIDRALFVLAHQQQIIGYDDFAGFQADLKHANASRAASSASGIVVYGSTSFTADEYYGRTVSDLKSALLKSLSKAGQLPVTATDVSSFLGTHMTEWSTGAARYDLTRLAVPIGVASGDLSSLIARAGGIEHFAATQPAASVRTDRLVGSTWQFSDGRQAAPQLSQQLPTLAVGSLTSPVTEAGNAVVYRLDDTTVDRSQALALYGTKIAALLQQQALDSLLQQRAQHQNSRLDDAAIGTITMKDITT